MTYVVLVILILLWAAVLLPPYLKDRRSSSRTFGDLGGRSSSSSTPAQRFLPLEQLPSNVVHLRPDEGPAVRPIGHGVPASSTGLVPSQGGLEAFVAATPDEQAFFGETRPGAGMPTTTAAARERRRHVLLALFALAFVTLLAAITVRGAFIAIHVAIDALTLGYVILLVKHRQMASERRSKIEPIRPPVTQQAPAHMQLAPSYLVERTGS